jgi:large subunit ribosomal protein L5
MAAPRLLERYRKEVAPKLRTEFSYGNPHQVPKLSKIVVNIGLGEAVQNPKLMEKATAELAAITGQKPLVRKSKKAIANFKLRAGLPIGCMVTLRGARMWEFFDRLVNVALPRVRTAAATTRSACASRSSFRKSSSTKSRRSSA